LLQNVTWFLFCVPHLAHITVGSDEKGFTAIEEPQLLQVERS
jgi:hypothetical protein